MSDKKLNVKSRPTKTQMKMLVELLRLNPELMSGKFTANITQKVAKEMWEEIACKLNALPGADKPWDKWKKAWQDTKNTAKTKAATIKRHSRGTGGGPPCNISLTEVQSDAIAQINEIAITGHNKSQESIVEFALENTSTKFIDSSRLDENIEIIMEDDPNSLNFPESEVTQMFETSAYVQPHQISATDPTIIEISGSKSLTPLETFSYQPPKRKSTQKPKLSKQRFEDTNSATIRLGDLAEKKIEMKEAYYSNKLKIMQEQCDTLKNINNSLLHLIDTNYNINQLQD